MKDVIISITGTQDAPQGEDNTIELVTEGKYCFKAVSYTHLLLGLGNAATPMGIRAARGMAKHAKNGVASSELCLLVVINTASIQLLPTTVAAVRAANGSAAPFDILPAVWILSLIHI